MRLWLRRLFHLRPILDRASVSARQADWLRRSAVPTEADEEARLRDEEGQDLQRPDGAAPSYATAPVAAEKRHRRGT